MKNLLKSNKEPHNNNIILSHISYSISNNCMNNDAYITCYKCRNCCRKFSKTGLLKKIK